MPLHEVAVLRHLAEKYKPILRLHEYETYYPSTIEFYVSNSEAYLGKRTKIADTRTLNPEKLIELQEMYSPQKISLRASDYALPGFDTLPNYAPFYVHISDIGQYWEIKYIFFYCYNGSLHLCGLNKCMKVGPHYSDVEHVTLRISKVSHNLIDMYFSAHGHLDGLWVTAPNIEFYNNDSRPVVYVARHTHACYPHARTYYRVFNLISDETSAHGVIWDPLRIEFVEDNKVFSKFNGYLGYPSCDTCPKCRPWFEKENGKSTNFLQRLFCCF